MTELTDKIIDDILNTPIYGMVRFKDFLDESIDPADCIELGTPYTPPAKQDQTYRTTGGWNEELLDAEREIVRRLVANIRTKI